jgi:phage tail-like protein
VSRGTVTDVPITRPIVRELPAIYQDGMFITEFTGGLDQVVAPAMSVLDCLHAYIDPAVAPADFVAWLGGWVGVTLQEDWTLERRRTFVARAAELFARRGTAHGLRDEVELYSGGSAEIVDPGGVWTSGVPTDPADRAGRRRDDRTVQVTVDVEDGSAINWPALQELIRDAVPAHLPVEIELRETA